jgi:gliding motility-associated-like protein
MGRFKQMAHRKYIIVMLLWLCNGGGFMALGQAPVIVPKSNPILKLDASGQYRVDPYDIADYQNQTDSALIFKFKPKSFDCGTLGPQKVNIKALTNGSASSGSVYTVGFEGMACDVAYDAAGNLYVVEDRSYYIRKITPAGVVTIFAGTGHVGAVNGPGKMAEFGNIHGITVDSKGNVYVAETSANVIRKITPDGIVSTFAGSGLQNRLDGKADKASFFAPWDVYCDAADNLFVADNGNKSIRKITPDGQVSTVAITGGMPLQVIADNATGIIYFTEFEEVINDVHGQSIKMISPAGVVSTYAGTIHRGYADGPLLEAQFSDVYSLAIDEVGNIYASDFNGIRLISNGKVSTLATLNAFSDWGPGVALDPCGNIVVAAQGYVRKYTKGGVGSVIAGGGFFIEGTVAPSTCQSADAEIPVTVQSTPTITSVYTDLTLQDCANLADYTIKATATDNCPDSRIKFSQSPAPNTPIYNNQPVTVTITATDKTGGTDSRSFVVTASYAGDPPGRSVTVSASAAKICAGELVTFNAAVINSDPGTTYQWLINGDNVGTNSNTFSSSELKNGDRVNCAVTTGTGCGIPNTGLDLVMEVSAKPVITLKATEEMPAGGSVNLTPSVTGDIAAYTWLPATGLSDAHSQFPAASPEITTTYTLKATTTAGCEDEASVTVTVITRVTIPNTFTPNSDGINDFWAIKYLNNYPAAMVTVFNRNGGLVFQSRGYARPWDGMHSGSPVSAGVYYYVIDLKDGSPVKAGNVSVIR